MEKIDPRTIDITQENIERLIELFPSVATETTDADGNVHSDIDLDALRELIGAGAEGQRERYQFTWPGKRAAKEEARRLIDKTLRPERVRSVNWDDTQNLYIEGDNLDALKILRSTYAGKVRLIYIDPPYNTGHDFVYDDDYVQTRSDYANESGDYDEDGGRLVANLEGNGRFHSDWCSMIYPRLFLARDLLSSDGAIFISIDDGELMNLRKICDEVFGGQNFKSDIAWQKRYTRSNNTVDFTTMIEHVLVYSKSPSFVVNLLPRTGEADDRYTNPDNDPRGPWKGASFLNPATPEQRPNLCYPIVNPNTGETTMPTTHAWRNEQATFERLQEEGRLYWGADGKSPVPSVKMFLSDARGMTPVNLWLHEYAGNTDQGSAELKDLMGAKVFDFPKPSSMMARVLEHASDRDSIVLDFFSGSASMAHGVMRKNAEDGGSRKFIMVQYPEECGPKSEARKQGYSTICEIGEERIRRAGAKIVAEVEEANRQLKLGEEPKPVPDVGFRVLRIDSSNFTDTYATPDAYDQGQLSLFEDNVKPDRSDLDLLFQVLPTLRIPYSATIEEIEVCGKRAFDVNHGQLVACFDVEVGADCIEQIAKMRPIYAVFRDASMADDATEANFEELFKTFSPDTVRRVI